MSHDYDIFIFLEIEKYGFQLEQSSFNKYSLLKDNEYIVKRVKKEEMIYIVEQILENIVENKNFYQKSDL